MLLHLRNFVQHLCVITVIAIFVGCEGEISGQVEMAASEPPPDAAVQHVSADYAEVDAIRSDIFDSQLNLKEMSAETEKVAESVKLKDAEAARLNESGTSIPGELAIVARRRAELQTALDPNGALVQQTAALRAEAANLHTQTDLLVPTIEPLRQENAQLAQRIAQEKAERNKWCPAWNRYHPADPCVDY